MNAMQIALAVFAALTVADIWTTWEFRKLGIAEANTWLDRAMGRHGFDELVLYKYLGFGVLLVLGGQGLIGVWPAIVTCAVQAGVVAWNLYRINQRRSNA